MNCGWNVNGLLKPDKWAIQVLCEAFVWKFDTHSPPLHNTQRELYIFVTLFSGKSNTLPPTTTLRYTCYGPLTDYGTEEKEGRSTFPCQNCRPTLHSYGYCLLHSQDFVGEQPRSPQIRIKFSATQIYLKKLKYHL